MSQITSAIPTSGPGSGTVTSITFNGGLVSTPDPVTTTGTATLDQTKLTVLDGTVYWDTIGQQLNTTATGASGTVLTSGGPGVAPSYQVVSASGVATITAGANISNSGTATNPIINVAGTTIHSVQVGTGATGLTSIAAGTTGEVLTGVTGADPVFASPAASSISITGDSGGALTGSAFTFTGGSTGPTFAGAGTTETLGGTLAIANGGTNATSMATTDGVVYYDGTRLVTTAVGTSTQVLTSNGAAVAPTFQAVAFTPFPWTDVTGASVALAVNNGYTLDRASAVTATLPATAVYGSIIEICAINTGLGVIAQNAGQTIWFSTQTHTTTGATGTVTFTSQYGSIKLLCTTANTDFTVLRSSGSFTIV